LTYDQEEAKLEPMKRTAKSLVVVGLTLLFASAVLCATLAAPSQSLASVSGCSQHNPAAEMTGCEHPSYLCGFERSYPLVSKGALSSARSNDSVKNILGMAVGGASFDSTAYGCAFLGNEHANAFPPAPHKVSIHLYNSVFTL
jgi:hypothetical protein